MLPNNNPHSERFNELLGQIQDEVDTLKSRISRLENEKKQLQQELKETKEKEADTFSSVKETDRMALKHQIRGLITKIDEHLEDQA